MHGISPHQLAYVVSDELGHQVWFFVLLCALALSATACSGSGAHSPVINILNGVNAANSEQTYPPNIEIPTQSPAASAPVHLQLSLPTNPAQTPASQSRSSRHLSYFSSGTTQLTITVTAANGSSTTYGPTSCTTSSCVVNFSTTAGLNTLLFTLSNGTTTLDSFTTTVLVVAATLNTLSFTANPVVNSVSLLLTTNTVNAGTPYSDTLLVNATDAAGETIVGSGNYTDATGNPISLLLTATNSQAGGHGSVNLLGPTRLTGPTTNSITAYYDGGWLDHTTISVSATRSLAGTITGTTLTTIPTATLYSTGISSGADPHGITTGLDGNIWFTEYQGNRIGRATPAGVSTEFSTGILPNGPVKILAGFDGNYYFSYQNSGAVQRITPSGTISTFQTFTYNGMYSMTRGPDGDLWGTEDNFPLANGNVIARFAPNGQLTEFSTGMTAGAEPDTITPGPDGNLWFTERTGDQIARITTNGTITEFSAGISSAARPKGIVLGPDGNLWFCEYDGNRIGRITPSGTITEFSSGISGGAQPRYIIDGPDGNMWFTEDAGGRLAKVTTSGTITEFTNGFGSGRLIDLTVGPDHNIWFTDFGDNKIGKFVY